jgi:hypothetical protein
MIRIRNSVAFLVLISCGQEAEADAAAGVPATRVVPRDVDGDGRRDALASFSVAALRAAGVLGGASSRVRVSVGARAGAALLTGEDRLFESHHPIVVLPAPAGGAVVGTSELARRTFRHDQLG